jgi:hypothetical protein
VDETSEDDALISRHIGSELLNLVMSDLQDAETAARRHWWFALLLGDAGACADGAKPVVADTYVARLRAQLVKQPSSAWWLQSGLHRSPRSATWDADITPALLRRAFERTWMPDFEASCSALRASRSERSLPPRSRSPRRVAR